MPQVIINVWNKIKIPLLILSALIPLLGLFRSPADPLLPIYTVFVLFFLVAKLFYNKRAGEVSNLKSPIKFALLILIIGLIAEALAWGVNFLDHRENPTLFHPQLAYDLLIGLSLYGAWAVIWFFWSRRYSFSLTQVFLIQGAYGVLLEQKGAIFVQGLLQMPAGIILWIYVFAVYGSITALAYLLSGGATIKTSQGFGLKKTVALLLSMFAVSIILLIIWGLLLEALKVLPKPMPIWERPLW